MKSDTELKTARSRLLGTALKLRNRLTPGELLVDGRSLARDRAIKLAAVTLASKKGRPVVAVGAIALAAAYLFRKPLARAIRHRLNKDEDHG